jgi:hypothetical protein
VPPVQATLEAHLSPKFLREQRPKQTATIFNIRRLRRDAKSLSVVTRHPRNQQH